MSKPLLVQVLWNLERAGAERMVLDLSHALSNDYEIEIVALSGGGALEEDFRAAGFNVTIAPPTSRGLSRREISEWLMKRWKENRPKLVHTHLGADVWAGYACRKLHIPQIVTVHGHEPGLGFATRMLRLWALRHATHVVCVSDSVRTMVRTRYGVSDEKLSVIRIGLDLARFTPRDAHQAGDMPHLITVGRLLEDKGQAVLIEALAKLRRPWTLEIVGDGPERLSLQRQAEMLGVMPRITFTGSIDNVPERLHNADLFLLASRHEGQAIAVLEAAAAQVPAMVCDLPVFHETFSDQSLIFVPVDDVDAWSDRIRDVLNQYGAALDRAHHARIIVEKHFSLESMAHHYRELYEDTASQ